MFFPLHRPGRLRGVIALSAVVASLALTVAGVPVLARADDGKPSLPFKVDVPRDHPWRNHSRLALDIARSLPGRDAEAGRRLAVRNLIRNTPKVFGPYIDLGPLHRNRFTVTIVGDQACAIWARGGDQTAEPGPCTAGDRRRFPDAAAMTAVFLGLVYDRTMRSADSHRERVQLISSLFTRRGLATLAWTYAPHGVGVAGIIDKNRDGLDDDARITLHAQGKAICLRLGVYPGQDSTFGPGICKNLEPRRIHYPAGARN